MNTNCLIKFPTQTNVVYKLNTVSVADMSCHLISPELGTSSFLCKPRILPPKVGNLRFNSQHDFEFPDSVKVCYMFLLQTDYCFWNAKITL